MVRAWLSCLGDTMYSTVEARLDHGRIITDEPRQLPETGRILVVVMEPDVQEVDWEKVRAACGKLKIREDTVIWQRRLRDEWNGRS